MSLGENDGEHVDSRQQPRNLNGAVSSPSHANDDGSADRSVPSMETKAKEMYNGSPSQGRKRKLEDDVAIQQCTSRAGSPPWKKIAIEGPTSFIQNGRRKSSRTNTVPLDLQPQGTKRRTRAAQTEALPDKTHSTDLSLRNGHSRRSAGTRVSFDEKLQRSAGKVVSSPPVKTENGRVTDGRVGKNHWKHRRAASNALQSFTVDAKKSISPPRVPPRPRTASSPTQPRQLAEEAANMRSPEQTQALTTSPLPASQLTPHKFARLRLKVRPPKVPVRNPQHIIAPTKFSSFAAWLAHDKSLLGEEEGRFYDESAQREADVRKRIVNAATPDGLLSGGLCSVYEPDKHDEQETLRRYGHWDHVISHALWFRKLMRDERKEHLARARRAAQAAAAEWRRRQPKTDEDILQEERAVTEVRRKQMLKSLQNKWDLVAAEVNKRRLVKWEERQQELQKQQLNQMLEHSTQMLDRRIPRGYGDNSDQVSVDGESTEEGDWASSSGESYEHEQNMSSAESEGGEIDVEGPTDEDQGLTAEQLREKYASLPAVNFEPVDDLNVDDGGSAADHSEAQADDSRHDIAPELEVVDDTLMDDSAESTDMSDDMGSSDNADASDAESEENEEEAGPGLLGFLSNAEVMTSSAQSLPFATPDEESGASTGTWEGIDIMEGDGDVVDDITETPSKHLDTLPDMGEGRHLVPPVPEEQSDHILPCTSPTSEEHPNFPDGDHASVNLSSVMSPRTSLTTKPSEADSATSIDFPDRSQDQSSATTPQPGIAARTKVPFLLRGTLREYQHYGLDWLAGLYASNQNGILADEMGLGKTIQTIALLAHLAIEHEVWGPHLIVVPTSVMLNWEMEFKKWCPGFKILTYYGTQEERKQKRKGWLDDDRWHVCITSYQLVLQDAQAFKRRNWHYLVLDEAHNIKNFRSQRWQTMLTFKTRARLLLTGTPLQNNLTELWSLVYFTHPDTTGFADLREFSEIFRRPVEQILEQGRETMDDEAKAMVTKLHAVLRPRLLRRMKVDVEKQMPLKYEHVVYCRLSKRQRQLYDGYMSLAQTRDSFASGNYLSIINCLMQLRKVCNHPDLFETRQIVTSFALPRSAVASYEIEELLVRRRLLREEPMETVNLDFLNLKLVANERRSAIESRRGHWLRATRPLEDLYRRQARRLHAVTKADFSSVRLALSDLETKAKSSRLEALRSCIDWTYLRTEGWPVYGKGLVARLTLDLESRPLKPPPKRASQLSEWFLSLSSVLRSMVRSDSERSASLAPIIDKFGCTTPAVVAPDLVPLTLTSQGISMLQSTKDLLLSPDSDPYHQARIRLSIAFPDARLLQYDCGKLQRLDGLLRQLQAGGHRALIFTQMTRVLDILEQFLSIHGHRYLRLDGATKIEQRQILTDRFNNDPRILAFILSSRSGGLGINLTGADTVIFYDLDWNPAMDKQCQDRCHRIGQTRDVHIYRFVSEYTIEANILRKSNQKRMLHDVVIQEGEFTTDYFNKLNYRDVLDDGVGAANAAVGQDQEANAAVDKLLGGLTGIGKALESVEDQADREAARVAQKELVENDDVDFEEKAPVVAAAAGDATPSVPPTPGDAEVKSNVYEGGTATPSDAQSGEMEGEVDTETTLEAAQSGLVAPDEVFVADDAEAEDITMRDADNGDDEQQELQDQQVAEPGHVDDYMLRLVEWELRDVPIAAPLDRRRKRDRRGDRGRKR